MDLSSISLSSQRLLLKSFTGEDAREAFGAATPTIARFMTWEPAPSLEAFAPIWQSWIPRMRAGTDVNFVVRDKLSLEFLGAAGLHNTDTAEPEAGIWIKESQHGNGYGRESIAMIVAFAANDLGKRAVVYPVVEQNGPSRSLAESLGGRILGTRLLRKASGIEHPEVVYRIPAPITHADRRVRMLLRDCPFLIGRVDLSEGPYYIMSQTARSIQDGKLSDAETASVFAHLNKMAELDEGTKNLLLVEVFKVLTDTAQSIERTRVGLNGGAARALFERVLKRWS
jgi:RimJ/RimL family protein N-acetyltransferase